MKRVHRFSLIICALFLTQLVIAHGAALRSLGSTPGPRDWNAQLPQHRIVLGFRNVNIDQVLHVLSIASGFPIVKDPSLTGAITLQSAGPVTLGESFALLDSVLHFKGYQLGRNRLCIIVQPMDSVAATPSISSFPLIQEQDSGDDGASRRVYHIQYADATYIAKVIDDVYGAGETVLSPAQVYGFRRSGIPELAAVADAGVVSTESPWGVKAVADEYSNTLIVKAQNDQQTQIAGLISRVDRQDQPVRQPYVVPLLYKRASDMAPIVEGIMAGSSTLGRGESFSDGDEQDGQGSLVGVDIRTNSLIITTTDAAMAEILPILEELDSPTEQLPD